MKKYLLFLVVFLFSETIVFSQCDDDIYLTTQAELDAFVEDYNCIDINESLIIGDYVEESDINNLSGLSTITSISGRLKIQNTPNLENLEGLDNLISIGGSFSIYNNSSLINLEGLDNLSSIVRVFYIAENHSLINFEGLENLTNINGYFAVSGNESFINFEGLDNLSSIGGNFFISHNPSLINFEGLENLTNINGYFDVSGNESLINFEGLESCTNFLSDAMYIHENPSLVSLSGLENLFVPDLTETIGIYDNPNLEFCCPLFIFEDFSNIVLLNNAPSCNSYDAILSSCTETKLQAQAFHDENENGFYDNSEQFLVQNIILEPSATYGYIDQQGVNNFYLPEYDNYTLSYDGSNPLWTIDPAYNNVELIYQDSTFQDTLIYFPLTSVADIASQQIDLSSSITRCNRETNYWLTYLNKGTVTTSGIIELIPDDLSEFISSDPPADSTSNDGKLYWFYNDLYPTHIEKIHLIYEMPGVDDLGEMINFEANIKTNEGYAGHRALLSSELICAYDPNDKLHTPSGYGNENYTLFGDTLEYTIRFQNTGNDTAFNVEIRDELSEFLNLSTFETISSSHNVETQIDIESRIATFKFTDIYLPDSFVNEPASHGFVKYQILGNAGLDENSDVKNTASIYFDENPAIVTNTVNNRMVSELPSLPVVSANPSVLDFGELPLDEAIYLPQKITVSNLGDLPLEINAFDFSNPAFNAGELQNLTIEGLSSQEIPIYFKPITVGDYESELVLQSNVGSLTINLLGKATMVTGLATFHQTKVQIYPNPSAGRFTLKSEGMPVKFVSIHSNVGELIFSGNVNNETFVIDLASQSKGLYFITLETDEGIVVDKVILY